MFGTIVLIVLKLTGALALFMYGMQIASDGIQRAAGEKLQGAVNLMTRNRIVAVLTGILVTVLLQSSSAATVMAVSFVNAGLLSLIQAIGVIMGSNIGTTVTGWIVSTLGFGKFSIVLLAVPIFGVGFFMSILRRRGKAFTSYGEALMGFALIFLALDFLSGAIPAPSGELLARLSGLSGHGFLTILACVLAGTVFTIIIRASSATLLITMGLASKGVITFPMAAALTLGANIGTCVDSFLVSLRANAAAKRAAYAHLFFNVIGALWVMVAIVPFLRLVDLIVPGELTNANLPPHIAMFHTIFNVANTLILLPFTRQYARFLEWLVRDKQDEELQSPVFKAPALVHSAELNLVQARNEVARLADLAARMFDRWRADLSDPPRDIEAEIERFKSLEEYGDSIREGLSRFLLEVADQEPSEASRETIGDLLRAVTELENVTDSCLTLAHILERAQSKKLKLEAEERKKLEPYTKLVEEFLSWVREGVGGMTAEAMARANAQEDSINAARAELRKLARRRIKAGADVRKELMFIDIVRHVEKIGDYAFSASQALRGR